MIEYLLIGVSYAFAAAVQPGPLQAYLLTGVLQKGWKKTLPASFSPLISDIPVALLVLLLLKNITPSLSLILQGAGGLLLIYLAWSGLSRLKKENEAVQEKEGVIPGTLLKAVWVNLLNPNPYLGWSLVMGPLCIKAWGENPINALLLISSFYITMVTVLAGTIILFGTTSFINEKNKHKLMTVSFILLGIIGIFQLVKSVV